MDSVIVSFGNTPYEQVEQALQPIGLSDGTITQGSTHFYFWRYSEQEQSAEIDENEFALLKKVLGSKPLSAFQIASRHNQSARLALGIISRLMSQFTPSIRIRPNLSFNGASGDAR